MPYETQELLTILSQCKHIQRVRSVQVDEARKVEELVLKVLATRGVFIREPEVPQVQL